MTPRLIALTLRFSLCGFFAGVMGVALAKWPAWVAIALIVPLVASYVAFIRAAGWVNRGGDAI